MSASSSSDSVPMAPPPQPNHKDSERITKLLIEKFTYKIKMANRQSCEVKQHPEYVNPIRPAQISNPTPGWKGCPNVNNRQKKGANKSTREYGPRYSTLITGDAMTRVKTYMRRALEARRTLGGLILGNPKRPGDEPMSDEMIFDFIMGSLPPDLAAEYAPLVKEACMAELATARTNMDPDCARNLADFIDWEEARLRKPSEFGDKHQSYYDSLSPDDRDSHYEWVRLPFRKGVTPNANAKRPTYVHGMTGCDLHSMLFCGRMGISHSDNTEFGGDSHFWGKNSSRAGTNAYGVYCMPIHQADTASGYSYGTTFGEDQARFAFLLELQANNDNESEYNIDTNPKQKCFDPHGGNTGNYNTTAIWVSSTTVTRIHHQEIDPDSGQKCNYSTYWHIWEDNHRHGFPGDRETHPFTPWILYFPTDEILKMDISLRSKPKAADKGDGKTDSTSGWSSGVDYADPIEAVEMDEVTDMTNAIQAYMMANQPPIDKIVYAGKMTGFHEGRPNGDKMQSNADSWRNYLEAFLDSYIIPNMPTQDALELCQKISQLKTSSAQYSSKTGKPVNNPQDYLNKIRVLAEAALASMGDHVLRVNAHMHMVTGNPPIKRNTIKDEVIMNVSTITFGDSLFELYKSTYDKSKERHVTRERTCPIQDIAKTFLTEYAGSKYFKEDDIKLNGYRHIQKTEGGCTLKWILDHCDKIVNELGCMHALHKKYKNACSSERCHPGPRIAIIAYSGTDMQKNQSYQLISQHEFEHGMIPVMRKLCVKLRDSFDRAVIVLGPTAKILRYQGKPGMGQKFEDERVFDSRMNNLAQIAREHNIPVVSSQRLYETCSRADHWHMYDTPDNTRRVKEFWCRIAWSQVESLAMSPAGMISNVIEDIVRPGLQGAKGKGLPILTTRKPSNLPKAVRNSAVSFLGARSDITKNLNITTSANVTTLFDMLDIDRRKENEKRRLEKQAGEDVKKNVKPINTDPGAPFVRMLSGVPECVCISCKTMQACIVPGTCTECNALDSLLPIFRLENVSDESCFGLKRPERLSDTTDMSKYKNPTAKIYNLNTLEGRAECCRDQLHSQGFDTFMEDQFAGMNKAYLVDEPGSMDTSLTAQDLAELERKVQTVNKGGSNKSEGERGTRWGKLDKPAVERPSDGPQPAKASTDAGKAPPLNIKRNPPAQMPIPGMAAQSPLASVVAKTPSEAATPNAPAKNAVPAAINKAAGGAKPVVKAPSPTQIKELNPAQKTLEAKKAAQERPPPPVKPGAVPEPAKGKSAASPPGPAKSKATEAAPPKASSSCPWSEMPVMKDQAVRMAQDRSEASVADATLTLIGGLTENAAQYPDLPQPSADISKVKQNCSDIPGRVVDSLKLGRKYSVVDAPLCFDAVTQMELPSRCNNLNNMQKDKIREIGKHLTHLASGTWPENEKAETVWKGMDIGVPIKHKVINMGYCRVLCYGYGAKHPRAEVPPIRILMLAFLVAWGYEVVLNEPSFGGKNNMTPGQRQFIEEVNTAFKCFQENVGDLLPGMVKYFKKSITKRFSGTSATDIYRLDQGADICVDTKEEPISAYVARHKTVLVTWHDKDHVQMDSYLRLQGHKTGGYKDFLTVMSELRGIAMESSLCGMVVPDANTPSEGAQDIPETIKMEEGEEDRLAGIANLNEEDLSTATVVKAGQHYEMRLTAHDIPLPIFELSSTCKDHEWDKVLYDKDSQTAVSIYRNFLRPEEAQVTAKNLDMELRNSLKRALASGNETPRGVGWYVSGDLTKGARCTCKYSYGDNLSYPPNVFSATIRKLTQKLIALIAKIRGVDEKDVIPPNSCNVVKYKNGYDSIGPHSDDEKLFQALEKPCIIFSLSLGATRRFIMTKKGGKKKRGEDEEVINLNDGELLSMEGMMQKYWRHAVPKQPKVKGSRFNLTWRWITCHDDGCPCKAENEKGPQAKSAASSAADAPSKLEQGTTMKGDLKDEEAGSKADTGMQTISPQGVPAKPASPKQNNKDADKGDGSGKSEPPTEGTQTPTPGQPEKEGGDKVDPSGLLNPPKEVAKEGKAEDEPKGDEDMKQEYEEKASMAELGIEDDADPIIKAEIEKGSIVATELWKCIEKIKANQPELVHSGPRDRFIICPANGITEEELAKQAGPEDARSLLKMAYEMAEEGIRRIVTFCGYTPSMDSIANEHTILSRLPEYEKMRREAIRPGKDSWVLRGGELLEIVQPDRSIRRSSSMRSEFIDTFVRATLELEHIAEGRIEQEITRLQSETGQVSTESSLAQLKAACQVMSRDGYVPMGLVVENWDATENSKTTKLGRGVIAYMMASDDRRRISAICINRKNNLLVEANSASLLLDDIEILAVCVRGKKSSKYGAIANNAADFNAIVINKANQRLGDTRFMFKGVSYLAWEKIVESGYIYPKGLDSNEKWSFFSPVPTGSRHQTPGGRVFLDKYDVCMMIDIAEMTEENYESYYTVPEGDFVITTPVWFRYVITAYDMRTGEWIYLRSYSTRVEEGPNYRPRLESSQSMWAGSAVAEAKKDFKPSNLGKDWVRYEDNEAIAMFGEKTAEGKHFLVPVMHHFSCPNCTNRLPCGMFICYRCRARIAYPELLPIGVNEVPTIKERPITNLYLGYDRIPVPDWGFYGMGRDAWIIMRDVEERCTRSEGTTIEQHEKNLRNFREVMRVHINLGARLSGDIARRAIIEGRYGRGEHLEAFQTERDQYNNVVSAYDRMMSTYSGGRVEMITGASKNQNFSSDFRQFLIFPVKSGITADEREQTRCNEHMNPLITNIFEYVRSDASILQQYKTRIQESRETKGFTGYQMTVGYIFALMLDSGKVLGEDKTRDEIYDIGDQMAIEIMRKKPWPRKENDPPMPIANIPKECFKVVPDDWDKNQERDSHKPKYRDDPAKTPKRTSDNTDATAKAKARVRSPAPKAQKRGVHSNAGSDTANTPSEVAAPSGGEVPQTNDEDAGKGTKGKGKRRDPSKGRIKGGKERENSKGAEYRSQEKGAGKGKEASTYETRHCTYCYDNNWTYWTHNTEDCRHYAQLIEQREARSQAWLAEQAERDRRWFATSERWIHSTGSQEEWSWGEQGGPYGVHKGKGKSRDSNEKGKGKARDNYEKGKGKTYPNLQLRNQGNKGGNQGKLRRVSPSGRGVPGGDTDAIDPRELQRSVAIADRHERESMWVEKYGVGSQSSQTDPGRMSIVQASAISRGEAPPTVQSSASGSNTEGPTRPSTEPTNAQIAQGGPMDDYLAQLDELDQEGAIDPALATMLEHEDL